MSVYEALWWLRIATRAFFVGILIGLLTGCARAEPGATEAPAAPPWLLPRFDGSTENRDRPPEGPLSRPLPPDSRRLFDLVVTCYPTRSWWEPEVAFEARLAQRSTNSAPTATTIAPPEGTTYAGIIARVPLYSAAEIDRERQREQQRRSEVSQAVGKMVGKLADREIHRRALALARAVEARSGRRVAVGVAETAEQIAAIKAVADAESALISDHADLIAGRLVLVGMCRDRSDVEAMLDALAVPR